MSKAGKQDEMHCHDLRMVGDSFNYNGGDAASKCICGIMQGRRGHGHLKKMLI